MVLASLNHPNIGGIYGLEESDSLRFLVLELVPGQTLAERLQEGPLTVAEALGLARQIAAALAAAHDAGVIHRDLKPANIKITPSEQVKVLDFGLAKALVDAPVDAAISDSPTLSAHATRMGVILGTAAYMSPDQARGKAVDKRTDIFSFGAVLYEMLTGQKLFKGEDAADTMASVIRSAPDFRALPADVPPRGREVLARCLEKDREKRRRDIGDIGVELEASPEPVAVDSPRRAALPWLLAATAPGAFLGAIAGWHLKLPASTLSFAIRSSTSVLARKARSNSSPLSMRAFNSTEGANWKTMRAFAVRRSPFARARARALRGCRVPFVSSLLTPSPPRAIDNKIVMDRMHCACCRPGGMPPGLARCSESVL
jgi:serine/threonine protein kinase